MSDEKKTLYERVGGCGAIAAVANDLLPRLQADPQLGFWAHRGELLIDFLCASAGGPMYYRGRDMALRRRGAASCSRARPPIRPSRVNWTRSRKAERAWRGRGADLSASTPDERRCTWQHLRLAQRPLPCRIASCRTDGPFCSSACSAWWRWRISNMAGRSL